MEAGPVASKWCHTHVELENLRFTWTIDNFSCCPLKMGETLQSEPFSMDTNDIKSEWCIKICPKGQNNYYSSSTITYPTKTIELHLISCSESKITAKFQFGVLSAQKEHRKGIGTLYTFQQGTKSVISLTDTEFIPDGDNDKLTIFCDLSLVGNTVHSSGQTDFSVPECTLSKDYGLLFENQEFSDFTIIVKDQKFPVHKSVLVARSPVFRAMFRNELGETKHGRTKITDIDPVVMRELLKYMYTGKVDELDTMTGDLLHAADKYDLQGLKLMCEQTLSKNLSVANAARTFLLADMYNIAQLKSYAINFINGHKADVMETPEWEEMINTHPQLIIEAYSALGAGKKPKQSPSKPPTKKRKTNC